MQEKTVEQYIAEMKRMYSKGRPETNRGNILPAQNEIIAEPVSNLPMDGIGSLIVVVSSAESRPLEGARVTVSSNQTGEVMAELFTDESGKTPPINLAAPLKAESLSPNSNDQIVYGLYDITATADNYLSSTIKDIPIFDSVVSIQQMRLLWIPAAGGITTEQNVTEANPYNL